MTNEHQRPLHPEPPLPQSTGTRLTPPPPPIPNAESIQFTTILPTLPVHHEADQEEQTTPTRAGLRTKPRLVLLTTVGCFWGFSIGSFLGGRQAGLQYLAENAHRLPTTVQGWYFYHKTKNYRMMLGGIKRGMQYAVRTGGLCLVYGAIEAGLDDIRGEADVANSVVAGLTTGTLFSTLGKYKLLFLVFPYSLRVLRCIT